MYKAGDPKDEKDARPARRRTVLKCAIAGGIFGICFAIGIHIYGIFCRIRFGDPAATLLAVAQMPAICICQFFGITINDAAGNLSILPLIVSAIITGFAFALIGVSIGSLCQRVKRQQ